MVSPRHFQLQGAEIRADPRLTGLASWMKTRPNPLSLLRAVEVGAIHAATARNEILGLLPLGGDENGFEDGDSRSWLLMLWGGWKSQGVSRPTPMSRRRAKGDDDSCMTIRGDKKGGGSDVLVLQH
jgi:hypothetical protein